MTNVRITFEKLGGITPDEMSKGRVKPVYDDVNVQMIFYINVDGKFTRKAILVVGGHTTAPPSSITYSSVVSRESAGISIILASLN